MYNCPLSELSIKCLETGVGALVESSIFLMETEYANMGNTVYLYHENSLILLVHYAYIVPLSWKVTFYNNPKFNGVCNLSYLHSCVDSPCSLCLLNLMSVLNDEIWCFHDFLIVNMILLVCATTVSTFLGFIVSLLVCFSGLHLYFNVHNLQIKNTHFWTSS